MIAGEPCLTELVDSFYVAVWDSSRGEKFPKHIYHSIICIGALIAHQETDHWVVDALGAPHVGERS